MGKRYDAEMFVESIAEDGAHGCNYLLTTDMEMEPVRGYRFASWELGYGDFHLVPDMATLRSATWLTTLGARPVRRARRKTHAPVGIAPRSILRTQTDAGAGAGLRHVRRVRAGALSLPHELRCRFQWQRFVS